MNLTLRGIRRVRLDLEEQEAESRKGIAAIRVASLIQNPESNPLPLIPEQPPRDHSSRPAAPEPSEDFLKLAAKENAERRRMKKWTLSVSCVLLGLFGAYAVLRWLIEHTFTSGIDTETQVTAIHSLVWIFAIIGLVVVVIYALRLGRFFSLEAEYGEEKKSLKIRVNQPAGRGK